MLFSINKFKVFNRLKTVFVPNSAKSGRVLTLVSLKIYCELMIEMYACMCFKNKEHKTEHREFSKQTR